MSTSITVTDQTANLVRKLAADLTSENNGKRVPLDKVIAMTVIAFRQIHSQEKDTTQD